MKAKRMHMVRMDGIKYTIRKTEVILEVLLLTFLFYGFWRNGYKTSIFPTFYGNGKFVLMGVYAFLICILFYFEEGFKFGDLKITDVVISQWVSILIVNFITYFQLSLIANRMISPLPLLALLAAEFLTGLLCTYVFTAIHHTIYVPRSMVMVYGNKRAISLKLKMDSRADKYQIQKLISTEKGYDYIIKEIPDYDAVVITDIPAQLRNDILKFCYRKGIRVYVTPKVSDVITRGASSIHLFDTPLLLVKSRGLNYEQKFIKRLFDIVLSGLALLLLWPFMLLIALAIKLEDGGPVFYRQRRMTIYNREFDILKFRSMIVDAEKDGNPRPATERDPRITKVGAFIRATRMDELPQILNILKGDMSIVGPRPERIEHVEKYTKEMPEFEFRSRVKGGLTGYAQVFGKYNTTAYDKLKLDLMYIENYSFLLDVKLILMTVSILFKKESTEGFDKQIDCIILDNDQKKLI